MPVRHEIAWQSIYRNIGAVFSGIRVYLCPRSKVQVRLPCQPVEGEVGVFDSFTGRLALGIER